MGDLPNGRHIVNPVVTSSFSVGYVVLSYAVSVLGAFLALTAAGRIRRHGSYHTGNIVAAGIALGGIGVWSMHFIGMVALKLDVASSYALTEAVVSLVAAIVASSLALASVARSPTTGRLLGAGALLGLGVVVMHYLGMFGMKIGGYIRWDYAIVVLSAVLAIAAATAALWLAFHTKSLGMRAAAALVMGLAVCAMHYTGMHAAEFICTVEDRAAFPQGFGYVNLADLPNLVAFGALAMAGLIFVHQVCQEVDDAAGELPFTRAVGR
jgi:NO-binding membrane sensor protein with MHYT domain